MSPAPTIGPREPAPASFPSVIRTFSYPIKLAPFCIAVDTIQGRLTEEQGLGLRFPVVKDTVFPAWM